MYGSQSVLEIAKMLETFLAAQQDSERQVPGFIDKEFRDPVADDKGISGIGADCARASCSVYSAKS
jgi:hypothetical protein